MSAPEALLVRSPNGKSHRVPPNPGPHRLRFQLAAETRGEWLCASDDGRLRVYHQGTQADDFAGAAVFNCQLDDVGQDFALITHSRGHTLLVIENSPPKCPVERFHEYVQAYAALLGAPPPGAWSIAGGAAPAGREPSGVAMAYRVLAAAAAIKRAARACVVDLPRHDAGPGGAAGIDVLATLAAWRQFPEWYAVRRQPTPAAIPVGRAFVLPIKAVKRVGVTFNLFVGATQAACIDLETQLGGAPEARVAAALLRAGRRHLAALDHPAELSPPEAWRYLSSARLPPRSAQLAKFLGDLRDELGQPAPHVSDSRGIEPYSLNPPELIFQDYAIAMTMVGLGVPADRISQAAAAATKEEGFRWNRLTFWLDTRHHGIRGWRDASATPANYKPDLLVLDAKNGSVVLADAKFRLPEDGNLQTASALKDMQSYMNEYGLRRSAVLVPTLPGLDEHADVEGGGQLIRVIAVPPEATQASAERIAGLLAPVWDDGAEVRKRNAAGNTKRRA